jgi:hypothetical protein
MCARFATLGRSGISSRIMRHILCYSNDSFALFCVMVMTVLHNLLAKFITSQTVLIWLMPMRMSCII